MVIIMRQIYVHGLGQAPQSWDKTIIKLGSAKQSVCPGLYDFLRNKESTYDNLYKGFSELCNDFNQPIDLCGLSLGGVLALNYAIEYPHKVNSLVLIAAQYKMPKGLLQFQNFIFRFMPDSMFTKIGFPKKDFFELCRSMMELDFSDSMHKISCPTLVVCGSKDSANIGASKKLASSIKNARLRIVPDVGHEINIEASEQLAELLLSFYKEHGD